MAEIVEWLFLVGRIVFGGFFVLSGIGHAVELDELADDVTQRGLPFPKATVLASGLMLVLGGAGVVLGVLPHTSLGLLIAFLVPAAFTMHAFWTIEDDDLQRAQMGNFSKNLALAGAALMALAVDVPWALSLG